MRAAGLEFDSLTGQSKHGVASGSLPLQCFFRDVLPSREAAKMGPATRYMLRRNTASIMKI